MCQHGLSCRSDDSGLLPIRPGPHSQMRPIERTARRYAMLRSGDGGDIQDHGGSSGQHGICGDVSSLSLGPCSTRLHSCMSMVVRGYQYSCLDSTSRSGTGERGTTGTGTSGTSAATLTNFTGTEECSFGAIHTRTVHILQMLEI
mgnify:CR=1 FL=1